MTYAEFKRWKLLQKRLRQYSVEKRRELWQRRTHRGVARRGHGLLQGPMTLDRMRSWGIPFAVKQASRDRRRDADGA